MVLLMMEMLKVLLVSQSNLVMVSSSLTRLRLVWHWTGNTTKKPSQCFQWVAQRFEKMTPQDVAELDNRDAAEAKKKTSKGIAKRHV